MIATPLTRDYMPQHVGSLLQMDKPSPVYWEYMPNQPVDMARNILVEKFRNYRQNDPDLKYILFIDSDATWSADAGMRLMQRDAPVITACIYKRSLPPVPCLGPYVGINKDGHHLYNFGFGIDKIFEWCDRNNITVNTDNDLVGPYDEQDIVEIDGCGAHFLMIRWDVIEAIKPPWFRRAGGGYVNAGEDFYFCRKAKAVGFSIYVDLSVHTGHLAGPGFNVGLRELLGYRPLFKDGQEEIWDVGK